MKIFKNRGDIYLSKSRTGADREQHILLGILAAVLLVSVVVVVYVGAKNDFSAKKFFAPDQTVAISQTADDTTAPPELPRVSGKTNYLLALTGKDNQNLYAAVLIQTDMDSVSYKICNLLPQTTAEGSTLAGVYNSGGINSLVQMTETATGIKPDFYIVMTVTDFASFFDDLGVEAQPMDVLLDGVDVLRVLLGRVGVVHAKVADAAEFFRGAEVDGQGLAVADMEIAVGLRGEPGVDRFPLAASAGL